jgi:RNA polymerase sigma-70 factor (ECF subfamily)
VVLLQEELMMQNELISNGESIDIIYKNLFTEHFEGLYLYAFTLLKSNEDAKDIVQQAFLRLWQKKNSLDIINSGKSYLYTSVYHLSLNAIRDKNVKEKKIEHLSKKSESEFQNPLEISESRKRINTAIEELPARCKEVFIKSRFDGKKYTEIAVDMNISVKTVEAQMGKALKLLREKLSDLIETGVIVLSITQNL